MKVLDKRLPGSLEHSEDCAVCATRRAACEHSEGDCAVC